MNELYFAPLEGITGALFRNAYHKYYKGVDDYYAPFISPYGNCYLTPKERRDVDPGNNKAGSLIPQILANNPEYFAGSALELIRLGYREININIGCPSGTVCSKKKGAGLLGDADLLDRFLEGVFNNSDLKDTNISVKTRIGVESREEFPKILEIYNKYPISKLIIHPRLRRDMYKGKPDLESFMYALNNTSIPVVYNGDICSLEDYIKLRELEGFQNNDQQSQNKISGVMIGRGLLKNPELAEIIKAYENSVGAQDPCSVGEIPQVPGPEPERFMGFHREIYEGYKAIISPDLHTLFRMKELWTYWITMFPGKNKEYKAILKSKYYSEYDVAVSRIC